MLSKLFSRAKGPGAPQALTVTKNIPKADLHYNLSYCRWHQDIRPLKPVVLIHDLASTGEAWTSFCESVGNMPRRDATPAVPLKFFKPHLRHHGRSYSDGITGKYPPGAELLDLSADIVSFIEESVYTESREPVAVVGHGYGALVALTAALVNPSAISQVVAIDSHTTAAPLTSLFDNVYGNANMGSMLQQSKYGHVGKHLEKALPNVLERHLVMTNVVERDCTAEAAEGSKNNNDNNFRCEWMFDTGAVSSMLRDYSCGNLPVEVVKAANPFKGNVLFVGHNAEALQTPHRPAIVGSGDKNNLSDDKKISNLFVHSQQVVVDLGDAGSPSTRLMAHPSTLDPLTDKVLGFLGLRGTTEEQAKHIGG